MGTGEEGVMGGGARFGKLGSELRADAHMPAHPQACRPQAPWPTCPAIRQAKPPHQLAKALHQQGAARLVVLWPQEEVAVAVE